jgi:hypothetical protein
MGNSKLNRNVLYTKETSAEIKRLEKKYDVKIVFANNNVAITGPSIAIVECMNDIRLIPNLY